MASERTIRYQKEELKRIESIPSESKTKGNKKFRPSVYQSVNPRSSTYVREGTMPERIAVPAGLAVATNLAAPGAGPVIGGTVGRTHNLQRDNVRSYHKKTGKPATGYVGAVDVGGYLHEDPEKLRAKIKENESKIKKGIPMNAFGVDHEPISKMGMKFNSQALKQVAREGRMKLKPGTSVTSPDGKYVTSYATAKPKGKVKRKSDKKTWKMLGGKAKISAMSPVNSDKSGIVSYAGTKKLSSKSRKKLDMPKSGIGTLEAEKYGKQIVVV